MSTLKGTGTSGAMIYRFERRARKTSTLLSLALIWAAFIALWIGLDMAWWILTVLAAFTLPALWDVIRDARSEIEVWPGRIVWRAAFSDGDRSDVDHVRLNRRFDGSMKVLLVHVGGATTRLPPDIAPPADLLETALKDAGISAERHPFFPF